MDWNHLSLLGWLSRPWVRQTYGAAAVALAVFCVCLSLKPLAVVRGVCEAKVSRAAGPPNLPSASRPETLGLDALQRWLTSPATLQQAKKQVAPVTAKQLQLFPDGRDPDALVVRVEHSQLPTAQSLTALLATGLADEMQRRQDAADQQERQRLMREVHAARQVVAAVEQDSQGLLFAMRSELANLEAQQQHMARTTEESSVLAGPAPAPPPQINPQWEALRGEVENLQAQLQQLRTKFTDEHPTIRIAEGQLQLLRARWEHLPQYLNSPESSPSVMVPATVPQQEWEPTGPVARFTGVQRTSAEEPTAAAPIVQQYLAELADCSRELATARLAEQRADAMLRTWEIRAAAQSSALTVSDVRIVEHLRELPRQSLAWATAVAILAGGATVLLSVRWSPALQRSEELSQQLGLPLLSVVMGRNAAARNEAEPATIHWQRYLINGAEFVVGAFVAAYVASSLLDPAFAELVGRDPLAAIPELWRR